ncbi:hypothetical protein C8Q80DRAFT_1266432 [Daedaleopsis nitida]|nr:hypothetical protein C8Q80DRAFT_1266432 [Daedaleopsis nitida]
MNATLTQAEVDEIIAEHAELTTTFYVGVASFTVLVWDHIITLSDEIEFVWRRTKGPLIWLFFINRYLTPFGFIVNLIGEGHSYDVPDALRQAILTSSASAYFTDLFSPETFVLPPPNHTCSTFVRYEGSMTVIGINTTALMMLLRVYAMYEKKTPVIVFCGIVFAVEFGTNAWLLTYGVAVRHTSGINACTMIFDPKVKGVIASASAWLPLLFDTIVLSLTLYRTYRGIKHYSTSKIMRVILREGIMYYSVIFIITLILTLMIVFAPDGLKNITAQTEYLMTVAMMSRITLHLKKQMHRGWDSHGLFGATTTSTTASFSGQPSHYNVPRYASGHTTDPALNITIQEFSVVHDDHGDEVVLDVAKTLREQAEHEAEAEAEGAKTPTRGRAWRARDEWHELRPVPVHINISHTRSA